MKCPGCGDEVEELRSYQQRSNLEKVWLCGSCASVAIRKGELWAAWIDKTVRRKKHAV